MVSSNKFAFNYCQICIIVALILLSNGCVTTLPEKASLTIPFQHQISSMYCVPASTSMVLAYYGDHYSQDTLKELATHRPNFEGTFYVDMIAGLHKIGYSWKQKTFGLDHQGFEDGLQAIKFSLMQGRPVLISTSMPPIGHTLIVSGFDDGHQKVELVNSLSDEPGMETMSYLDLEKIWHDDFQHKVRSLLITYPRN